MPDLLDTLERLKKAETPPKPDAAESFLMLAFLVMYSVVDTLFGGWCAWVILGWFGPTIHPALALGYWQSVALMLLINLLLKPRPERPGGADIASVLSGVFNSVAYRLVGIGFSGLAYLLLFRHA